MDVKTKGFQLNSVVFTLPDVEVGSILEYRVTMRRDEEWTYLPTWQVRADDTSSTRRTTHSRPGSYQQLMYSSHVGPNAKVIQDKRDAIPWT